MHKTKSFSAYYPLRNIWKNHAVLLSSNHVTASQYCPETCSFVFVILFIHLCSLPNLWDLHKTSGFRVSVIKCTNYVRKREINPKLGLWFFFSTKQYAFPSTWWLCSTFCSSLTKTLITYTGGHNGNVTKRCLNSFPKHCWVSHRVTFSFIFKSVKAFITLAMIKPI